MKIRTNQINTHTKYKDFKAHSINVSNLEVDDIVKMTINGIEQFSCTVLYGEASQVQLSVQDKGLPATKAESIQAEIDRLVDKKAEEEAKEAE